MGILEIIGQGLKIIAGLLGWWIRLDDANRKEIHATFQKLLEAEKNGKQADIRSAINRLNANL